MGKKMVHMCTGIIFGHKKEHVRSVLMRWMNLEPIIQSEVSQREKQILYINTYIWNLGK